MIGVICDSTGYSTDGAVSGGEILLCSERILTRMADLDYFPLVGGGLAARLPWRPALTAVRKIVGDGEREEKRDV